MFYHPKAYLHSDVEAGFVLSPTNQSISYLLLILLPNPDQLRSVKSPNLRKRKKKKTIEFIPIPIPTACRKPNGSIQFSGLVIKLSKPPPRRPIRHVLGFGMKSFLFFFLMYRFGDFTDLSWSGFGSRFRSKYLIDWFVGLRTKPATTSLWRYALGW